MKLQHQDSDLLRCSAVSSLCMDNLRQRTLHHPGSLPGLRFAFGWGCQLKKHLTHGCAGSVQGGFGQVAAAAFEQLHRCFGLTEARALVDRLVKVPSPGGSFWHAVLLAELEETRSHGAHSDVKRTKRLFEVRSRLPAGACRFARGSERVHLCGRQEQTSLPVQARPETTFCCRRWQ